MSLCATAHSRVKRHGRPLHSLQVRPVRATTLRKSTVCHFFFTRRLIAILFRHVGIIHTSYEQYYFIVIVFGAYYGNIALLFCAGLPEFSEPGYFMAYYDDNDTMYAYGSFIATGSATSTAWRWVTSFRIFLEGANVLTTLA